MDFSIFLKKRKTYKNHVQQMKKNWNEYFRVLSKNTEIKDLAKPSSIEIQPWSFKYQHQLEFLRIPMHSYTRNGGCYTPQPEGLWGFKGVSPREIFFGPSLFLIKFSVQKWIAKFKQQL